MKKRRTILLCLVAAGIVGVVGLRAVPFGAFGTPYLMASFDEGHRVPGMPWRIVYNDAGAAHSGNFWTWVIEERWIFPVVVAQGYSNAQVRYGQAPLPVKVEGGSIYLGFARSRYGDELEWRKVDTRKSLAGLPNAHGKSPGAAPQASDPVTN